MSTEADESLRRALGYLRAHQLPHGEFATYVANDPGYREGVRLDSAVFGTTFVLWALHFVRDLGVDDLASRALDFLEAEVGEAGIWGYWSTHNEKVICPDLDDTSCVSHALQLWGRTVPDNRDIFLDNRNEAGRFRTWIRRPLRQPKQDQRTMWPAFNDAQMEEVDCVVNSNVLLYLGHDAQTDDAVTYLRGMVEQQRALDQDVYYLTPLAFPYALSRATYGGVQALSSCRDPVLAQMMQHRRPDGSFGDPLATGLAACTMLNFGVDHDILGPTLGALRGMQRDDGAWDRVPFFTGPHCGSEEITTAFAIEALGRGRGPVIGACA